MAFFCPADQSGPRILTLLHEFEGVAIVESHNKWIRLLHTACERQRCHVAECSPGDYFSQTHGAKTLANSITMFLTYYVPRKVALRSDDEWREVLAALRTFHDFCVRRSYVREDPVLMTALHRLRRFRICSIPKRLEALADEKYWDAIERAQTGRGSKLVVDSGDVGTGSTAVDGEGSSRTGGVGGDVVQEDEESYEMFIGDEEPLSVDEILSDGWVIYSEDSDGGERCKAFLHLPEDLAKLGMQGMSLSCMKLALRNGVWRPIRSDGTFVAHAYPPDDVFYY